MENEKNYKPLIDSKFDIYDVPMLPDDVTTPVYAILHRTIGAIYFYKSKATAQKAISMVNKFTEVLSKEDGNSDVLPVLKKSGIV